MLKQLSLLAVIAGSCSGFSILRQTAILGQRSSLQTSRPLYMASDKPLTELVQITKEACDAVSPMLKGNIGE